MHLLVTAEGQSSIVGLLQRQTVKLGHSLLAEDYLFKRELLSFEEFLFK